jgi:hypothetical protein
VKLEEKLMTPLTIYLSQLIGLTFLIIALSLLFRRDFYVEMTSEVIDNHPLLFVFSLIRFVAGLAIVLAHNRWSGGVAVVLVSLIGWIELVRGLFFFFLPSETLESVFEAVGFERHYYVYAGITLVIGAYLAFAGFTA